MIGLLGDAAQGGNFGLAMNNIVIMESFVPGFDFPGLQDFLGQIPAPRRPDSRSIHSGIVLRRLGSRRRPDPGVASRESPPSRSIMTGSRNTFTRLTSAPSRATSHTARTRITGQALHRVQSVPEDDSRAMSNSSATSRQPILWLPEYHRKGTMVSPLCGSDAPNALQEPSPTYDQQRVSFSRERLLAAALSPNASSR